MLADRDPMLISTVVTSHIGPAAAFGGGAMAALYAVVTDVTTVPTIGIGSAGALLLSMVALLFRSQQQEIRRQQRRIDSLERELDDLRRKGGH